MKEQYLDLIYQAKNSSEGRITSPIATLTGLRNIGITVDDSSIRFEDQAHGLEMFSYLDVSYKKSDHLPLCFGLTTKKYNGERNGFFFGSHFYDATFEYFRDKDISSIESNYPKSSDTQASLLQLLHSYHLEYDINHALNPKIVQILQENHWAARQAFRHGYHMTSLEFFPQDTDDGKEFPPDNILAMYTTLHKAPISSANYPSMDLDF